MAMGLSVTPLPICLVGTTQASHPELELWLRRSFYVIKWLSFVDSWSLGSNRRQENIFFQRSSVIVPYWAFGPELDWLLVALEEIDNLYMACTD